MVPIIQTSIVGIKHIKVLSSQDDIDPLGFGVTPQILNKLQKSSVMDSIISSTITGKLSDKQPFLWSTHGLGVTSVDANITNSSSFNDIAKEQFVATFPVGTDTGVLRDLVLRLNMSVGCSLVPQSDFPSTCPGAFPLSQTLSNINSSDISAPFGDSQNPRYRARICAPGDTMSSPWKDIPDRQDITEEFWLDYQQTFASGVGIWGYTDTGSNYTQHCYGKSTLGYFELPNHWNSNVAGPLLDKVPPNGPNLTYRNGLFSGQLTAGPPVDSGYEVDVPGPFLTAVLAVFGPGTFFTAAAENSNVSSTEDTTLLLCRQLRYPFTGLGNYMSPPKSGGIGFTIDWKPGDAPLTCYASDSSDDPVRPLLGALFNWLPNFGDNDKATAALTLATYAAANAILNAGPKPYYNDSFPLYTSAGTSLQTPDITLAGMVVVSLLFGVQIIGLALLAVYASRRGTWTGALDSWAMLKLGAEIGKEGLPSTVSAFEAIVNALEAKRVAMVDPEEGSSLGKFEAEEDGRRV